MSGMSIFACDAHINVKMTAAHFASDFLVRLIEYTTTHKLFIFLDTENFEQGNNLGIPDDQLDQMLAVSGE